MADRYYYKTKPYKHQVAALKKLISNGFGGALLMEPRTGKTKVCIDYASILNAAGKCDRVVVVCPVSVMDVWLQEIKTHCPAKYRITVWDKKARKTVPLPKFGQGYLDFVIINYDAFSAPGRIQGRGEEGEVLRARNQGGRYDVMKAFKDWQPHLIILDESHRIKSPSAKAATSIVGMQWRKIPPTLQALHGSIGPQGIEGLVGLANYRVIATGTAVTKQKRIFDLYMQWKFLNPGSALVAGHTATTFKAQYGVFTSRNGYRQWLRNQNEMELHRLVHEDSYAVTRAECFDLPKAFPPQIVHVPLEESARVYDEMAEEMVAKIESGEVTEASIALVQSLRLCQITSGLARTSPTEAYPEGRLVRIGQEKLRYLQEFLTDYFDQDEKVVICARFRGDIVGIQDLCRKLGVEPQLLVGGMKRHERTDAIETFRKTQGKAAFVMNPQAGSLGIDLRTASTMIWFSLTTSYVDYTQSLDRIALSDVACRFIYLLGKGTYDELLYDNLQKDGDVAKAIMKRPEVLLRRD